MQMPVLFRRRDLLDLFSNFDPICDMGLTLFLSNTAFFPAPTVPLNFSLNCRWLIGRSYNICSESEHEATRLGKGLNSNVLLLIFGQILASNPQGEHVLD